MSPVRGINCSVDVWINFVSPDRSLTALLVALGITLEVSGGAMDRVEAVIEATSESAGDSNSSSSSSLFRFQDTLLSARLNAFVKHCDVTSPSCRLLLHPKRFAKTA